MPLLNKPVYWEPVLCQAQCLLHQTYKDNQTSSYPEGSHALEEDTGSFSSGQLFSHVQLFATPWTAACQASLSFTISQTLLKRSNNIQPHITAPPGWALFPRRWIVQPGQRNTGLNQLWVQILAQPLSSYLNLNTLLSVYAVVVCQWLSHVWLFVTPWTAVHQASLFLTISQSFSNSCPIEAVLSSNCLILSHPLFFLPSIFPSHQGLFQWASSSHQVDKVLELQLQHQSFQ